MGSGVGVGGMGIVSAPAGSLVGTAVGVAGIAVGECPVSSFPPPQPDAMIAIATKTMARRQHMAETYRETLGRTQGRVDSARGPRREANGRRFR